jgi:hypothetical protein
MTIVSRLAGRLPGLPTNYNPAMASPPKAKPRGPWTPEEIARHKRADRAQVEHDRARGMSANLAEAAALARFANRFAEAFRHARRA